MISREKLEAYIELSEKLIEDSPEPFPKFNNARVYELSFLRDAIRSGELDADPWIPVSTPPEGSQIVRIELACGDKVKAIYYDNDWHILNFCKWISTESKREPMFNVISWQPITPPRGR